MENYFFVISRLFQKWYSSGVVSASLSCTVIGFTNFSGILQDPAVTLHRYLLCGMQVRCGKIMRGLLQ